MKTAIQKAYPFFDDNALDAARFLFGATTGEVIWHEGWMSIMEVVADTEPDADDGDFDDGFVGGPITEGSRNKTLSLFSGRVLKRYGECDKAHEVFLEQAAKCDPPLEDAELSTIWFSALKFFRNKISGSNGYVPPDQYNNDFGGEPGSLSNVMPLQQSVIRNIKQHAYSKDDKHCDKLTVRDMHRAVYSIAFAERVLHQESDDACSDDNRNSLCQHLDSAWAVR